MFSFNRRAKAGRRLDAEVFRASKKRLIERQCRGTPRVHRAQVDARHSRRPRSGQGAAAAKTRRCLKRGALDSLPMGYLLCGPVGTGKSFLAQCVSGEIGVPCVMLKNFRSKYVGETEGNLEACAVGAARDGAGRRGRGRSRCRARQPRAGWRLRHVEPRLRNDCVADGRHAATAAGSSGCC